MERILNIQTQIEFCTTQFGTTPLKLWQEYEKLQKENQGLKDKIYKIVGDEILVIRTENNNLKKKNNQLQNEMESFKKRITNLETNDKEKMVELEIIKNKLDILFAKNEQPQEQYKEQLQKNIKTDMNMFKSYVNFTDFIRKDMNVINRPAITVAKLAKYYKDLAKYDLEEETLYDKELEKSDLDGKILYDKAKELYLIGKKKGEPVKKYEEFSKTKA